MNTNFIKSLLSKLNGMVLALFVEVGKCIMNTILIALTFSMTHNNTNISKEYRFEL
jgi:hypothetical protein